MKLQKLEEKLHSLNSMASLYEELANKEFYKAEDLESTKAEMKAIKQHMLSTIIETKKILKHDEKETSP